MQKPRIYVTRNLPSPGIELLSDLCDVQVNPNEHPPSKHELMRNVADADGILCLVTDRIDDDTMTRAPNLKVISSMSVGYDHIDVEAATKKGIYVTFTPGVLTEATADFAWTLLMAVNRRVVEADNCIREGNWTIQWGPSMFLGRETCGKTLGIVGLGRIGQAVARRARSFNMKILYYDVVRATSEIENQLHAEFVPLSKLLEEADFVTLHVPLTKETRHVIGEEELKKMKRTAYLVNTARGPLVDEAALAKALSEGWIAGAGLDVFEKEPIEQKNPLMRLRNVVLTPHIASATIEARSKMAEVSARNLVSVLRGEMPMHLVNPDVQRIKPLSMVKMIS